MDWHSRPWDSLEMLNDVCFSHDVHQEMVLDAQTVPMIVVSVSRLNSHQEKACSKKGNQSKLCKLILSSLLDVSNSLFSSISIHHLIVMSVIIFIIFGMQEMYFPFSKSKVSSLFYFLHCLIFVSGLHSLPQNCLLFFFSLHERSRGKERRKERHSFKDIKGKQQKCRKNKKTPDEQELVFLFFLSLSLWFFRRLIIRNIFLDKSKTITTDCGKHSDEHEKKGGRKRKGDCIIIQFLD